MITLNNNLYLKQYNNNYQLFFNEKVLFDSNEIKYLGYENNIHALESNNITFFVNNNSTFIFNTNTDEKIFIDYSIINNCHIRTIDDIYYAIYCDKKIYFYNSETNTMNTYLVSSYIETNIRGYHHITCFNDNNIVYFYDFKQNKIIKTINNKNKYSYFPYYNCYIKYDLNKVIICDYNDNIILYFVRNSPILFRKNLLTLKNDEIISIFNIKNLQCYKVNTKYSYVDIAYSYYNHYHNIILNEIKEYKLRNNLYKFQ